jgi:hypothetical protein
MTTVATVSRPTAKLTGAQWNCHLAASLLHAQAFLYRSDISLYLSKSHPISWLNVISQAFDFFERRVCGFPHRFDLIQDLRRDCGILPYFMHAVSYIKKCRDSLVQLDCGAKLCILSNFHDFSLEVVKYDI